MQREQLHAPSCAQVKGQQLSVPFPRLTYAEAMERYGCDKPDMRYCLELRTVSAAVAGSTFRWVLQPNLTTCSKPDQP